ncbi:hypothetical protein D3C76_1432860 [compost metagenome]
MRFPMVYPPQTTGSSNEYKKDTVSVTYSSSISPPVIMNAIIANGILTMIASNSIAPNLIQKPAPSIICAPLTGLI